MDTFRDRTAGGGRKRVVLAAQRAQPGEHLCSFHASEEERRRLVGAFVLGALGAGDRILYVANEHAPEQVERLVRDGGVRADVLVDSGQLLIRDFTEIYGAPDPEDVVAVLARYVREAARSRADGYPGLRVAVEMGDFVGALGSVDAVARWERRVTDGLGEAGIAILCEYDERIVPPGDRARIAAAHPVVATVGESGPLATFAATETGVRVAGELDRSNAEAFARVLHARMAAAARTELDFSELTFADVAALRTVFELAANTDGRSVVLRNAPGQVRRLVRLVGWRHERVEIEP